ncbi:hypothetical protein ACQP1W_26610 [Spirillospora sp. CA-255316]
MSQLSAMRPPVRAGVTGSAGDDLASDAVTGQDGDATSRCDAAKYVNAAILGRIIGSRSDAGAVATLRWLARRRRRPQAQLTEEQLIEIAIQGAVRYGHSRRRLRCLEVARGVGAGERPVVILRVTWSKTVLVVRVDTVHPEQCEVTPVKLFPPRR